MKQVFQDLADGSTTVVEAPAPDVLSGSVLIDTTASLISAGTERMIVGFGKANPINKVRQQPDKVRMVLDKVRTDGLLPTIEAVRTRLAQPIALGYSAVGVVAATGAGVDGFSAGDRVVSNGRHADVIRVPKHLCARIPDGVSDHDATFTVVGSIALQGIRLAQPTLGEAFVVTGAGLIGLLAVQILRANGCRVLAIDYDAQRLALARQFGAHTCNPGAGEDPVAAGNAFSRGRGIDGVIITAATPSNEPVSQAAQMCRKRGRIVLVGVVGLELNRAEFYEKELSFQVSCSYGPGRYDPEYEEGGHDYPIGFVRWTEQRNFEAVLEMMADGRLQVEPLVSHLFSVDDAATAYDKLTNDKESLGIILEYAAPAAERHVTHVALRDDTRFDTAKPVVSFVGAGNYASRMLIPAFAAAGAQFETLVTSGGTSGVAHGKRFGFAASSTVFESLLGDGATNTVVIATRHDSHARFTAAALRAGRHVFVEKPLALTAAELDDIEAAYREAHAGGSGPQLMVGFNRRFAPHVRKVRELLAGVREAKVLVMTVNAGAIPPAHWVHDRAVGGGRIIGEGCHFIDLLRHLAGSPIAGWSVAGTGSATHDTVTVQLSFKDGSTGTVHYLANGNAAFPKERLEVFASGGILRLNNFRELRGFGWPGFSKDRLWRQDKGQTQCAAAFLQAIEHGRAAPIPFDELLEVGRATLSISDAVYGAA